MIQPGYLRTFALSVAIMFAAYLAFTSIVDPYGVSPLRLTLPGLNAVKPKARDRSSDQALRSMALSAAHGLSGNIEVPSID
jgi:hypothetical protein